MKEKDKNKIEKKVKREVKKQTKKTVRKHKKAVAITIAVIAIVLIISIVALYVFKPDLFNGLIDIIKGMGQEDPPPAEQEGNSGSGSNEQENAEMGKHLQPIESAQVSKLDQGDLKMPVISQADNKLKMTMVDVGQGDGIVVELPDERVMYIDGGARFRTFSAQETYEKMESALKTTDKIKSGSNQIDYLFISHADYDHIQSLPLLFKNYEVINICFPRIFDLNISSTWNKVYDLAQKETYTNKDGEVVKSHYIENVGHYMLGGEEWSMNCYSFLPEDYPIVKESSSAIIKNKISPICILEYAERKIVLTGDATKQTEEYLLSKPDYFPSVDVDILKVGHHGARESTSAEFLNAIDAEYALISCATTDYGHPHKELLDRLNDYKDLVKDDDFDGFKEKFITRDDGNVNVEIEQDGTMRIISTKNSSKNIEDVKVVIVAVSEDIHIYAIINKEEDSEGQYTLNCA